MISLRPCWVGATAEARHRADLRPGAGGGGHLEPDVVEAVLDERSSKGVRLEDLVRPLPVDWVEQRRNLLNGGG